MRSKLLRLRRRKTPGLIIRSKNITDRRLHTLQMHSEFNIGVFMSTNKVAVVRWVHNKRLSEENDFPEINYERDGNRDMISPANEWQTGICQTLCEMFGVWDRTSGHLQPWLVCTWQRVERERQISRSARRCSQQVRRHQARLRLTYMLCIPWDELDLKGNTLCFVLYIYNVI